MAVLTRAGVTGRAAAVSIAKPGDVPACEMFRCAALVLMLMLGLFRAGAAEPAAREYEIKGVLLFHLAQFVDWPTNAFDKPNSKFVIGILGDDPFGPTMDKIVAGEKTGEHPIVVERYANISAATNCHILFVSASGRDALKRIVTQLDKRPVLTVSDVPNFTQSGGMVDFFMGDQRKVRLRVNPNTAKSAGLTVSSKLLRVAEVARAQE